MTFAKFSLKLYLFTTTTNINNRDKLNSACVTLPIPHISPIDFIENFADSKDIGRFWNLNFDSYFPGDLGLSFNCLRNASKLFSWVVFAMSLWTHWKQVGLDKSSENGPRNVVDSIIFACPVGRCCLLWGAYDAVASDPKLMKCLWTISKDNYYGRKNTVPFLQMLFQFFADYKSSEFRIFPVIR